MDNQKEVFVVVAKSNGDFFFGGTTEYLDVFEGEDAANSFAKSEQEDFDEEAKKAEAENNDEYINYFVEVIRAQPRTK